MIQSEVNFLDMQRYDYDYDYYYYYYACTYISIQAMSFDFMERSNSKLSFILLIQTIA